MTHISYIAGIGSDEYKDRSVLVPTQSYIDYTALTDGELRLTLLADQVNILSAFYPEDQDLQKSKNILVDALYKGVHRTALPGGVHAGILATVVKELRFARENVKPAAGRIIGRKNGIGSGIGDPLIPYDDCTIYQENEYGQMVATNDVDPDCLKNNNIKKILNENLEKAGHHILYEFVSNPNAQPATVAAKTLNHRAVKATVSKVSKLSQDNMRLWLRNGIIRNNAARGAAPMQPEMTIDQFKAKSVAVSGVGFLPAAVVIIQCIVAAIAATATLVSALKSKDSQTAALWNQFQGIGTGVFGPETYDWQGGGGGGGGGGSTTEEETDFLPIIIIGGAAAVLLMK